MRQIDRNEITKKKALASTAKGAVSNDTRPPPRAGPEICAADLLLSRMLLPCPS
jgi:hypothetical protein